MKPSTHTSNPRSGNIVFVNGNLLFPRKRRPGGGLHAPKIVAVPTDTNWMTERTKVPVEWFTPKPQSNQ